jgi:8-amino-7-oxononanoate synthase
LGLSEDKNILSQTFEILKNEKYHSPRASMLVNGYSKIHYDFEQELIKQNFFENALVFGSGFLANFGIIEALVRNGDFLFVDELYHASGIVATKLIDKNRVIFFSHNSPEDLTFKIEKIKKSNDFTQKSRIIIAVEGIYSMEGTILKRDFFEITNNYNALLIVDEAHSFGVIGDNLLGIFDYYKIKITENHIKLGTLGKAMGSYGAYVLASDEVISFLENRAKTAIYSTAPSLFDILYSHLALLKIKENLHCFKTKIAQNRTIFNNFLDESEQKEGLIFTKSFKTSSEVLQIQEKLKNQNYLVGAIRPPTVSKPILRIIPRTVISKNKLKQFLLNLENTVLEPEKL